MFLNAALVVAATYVFGNWTFGAAVAVLLLIWQGLPDSEGPPVLKLAMSAQWMQVAVGLFYTALGGRQLGFLETPAYDKTVGIALGTVAALTLGLIIGVRMVQARKSYPEVAPEHLVSFQVLMVVYFGTLAMTGVLQELAASFEPLRQAAVAVGLGRLAVLSLVLRRLVRPTFRWDLVLLLIGFEVGLGFTGYFSGFKEPLLLAVLALMEVFDRRRVDHVVAGTVIGASLLLAAVMWMGVRTEFRRDFEDEAFAGSRSLRLQRMQALFSDWYNERNGRMIDNVYDFVDRASAIYYPSLAVERVPMVLPHTNGALLGSALIHIITPRIIFPNKPALTSDSELVRKYSGVWVAGDESNTSIAFGYMAESYVDFGVPLMFLPVLIYGIFMGNAYEWFLRTIAHRELAVSLVMSVFWINLYLFEKAWAKMLGDSLTVMVYVGGIAFLVDRWLLMRQIEQADDGQPVVPAPWAGGAGRQV